MRVITDSWVIAAMMRGAPQWYKGQVVISRTNTRSESLAQCQEGVPVCAAFPSTSHPVASPGFEQNRSRLQPRKLYPTDLTDAQWELLPTMLPTENSRGCKRTVDLREVINAIL